MGSPVGGDDLWWEEFMEQCVLNVEWKREREREEVMDGVMVVTDDERG